MLHNPDLTVPSWLKGQDGLSGSAFSLFSACFLFGTLGSESESGLVTPLFFFLFIQITRSPFIYLAIWSPSVCQTCVRCWSYKWARSLCFHGACSLVRNTNHECEEAHIPGAEWWLKDEAALRRDGTPYLSSHRWLMTKLKLKRSFGNRNLASCHHLLQAPHSQSFL